MREFKIRNYTFQIYVFDLGIDLYIDTILPERHFLVNFKDKKEVREFVNFLLDSD